MINSIKCLDFVIYWSIVLLPFSISISSAPMNVFAGLLIAGFLAKRVLKKEPIFVKTPINLALFCFFLLTCLSIFHTAYFKDTLKGGIFRLFRYILIVFIMAQEVRDRKHIWRIIASICLGIVLASLDEIWQVFTGKDFIRGYAPILNIGLLRATASFKDANTLGVYLSAISPLVFGLTIYFVKGIKRIWFILVMLLSLLGIALTYSRPTLLAAYVSLFFLGIARKNKYLIGLLIIFTLASPFLLPKSVKEFAKSVDYNPIRFMCNDDRIAMYRHSLNMLKAHPFMGLGANTYMKNYRFYKEYPEYRNSKTADYIYAHNQYLQMAAELGLIGLGIFIWLLYKLFNECRNIYKKLDDHFFKIISLSVTACLLAFLVNGLTESSLYYSRVAVLFWYFIGLSLALKRFTMLKENDNTGS